MMIPVQNTKLEHFSSLNSCFYFIFSLLHQTKVFSSEKKNLYVWVSIYFSWAMVRNSGFLLICTTYSSIEALHICIAYCISCAQSHFGADSTCFCIILNSSSFFSAWSFQFLVATTVPTPMSHAFCKWKCKQKMKTPNKYGVFCCCCCIDSKCM